LTVRVTSGGNAELRDGATVVDVARLGGATRVELGTPEPQCGDDCASLALPAPPTGLVLTGAGFADGATTGVAVHGVDLFDR
jgi:hypothetical protein